MSLWTLTVVDGTDIVTTTHPSLDDALACFQDNYDTLQEWPRTLSGMQDAAHAQGIHAEITEQEV